MLYFIEDVGVSSLENSASINHYPSNSTLLEYELRLLEEILWLMCNLSNQEAIAHAFASDRFDQQIYLIARNFSRQFKFAHWRVLLWSLRMLSGSLHLFEEKSVEIGPYYNFLATFKDEICSHILDSTDVM